MDLFQLPPDFDTGQHTIVRVTANEVRKKLAQQYLAENGSPHPVRIDLPPGSYSAEFRWESSAAEHVPARLSWLTRPAIACGAAILVLAGAFSLWRGHAVKPIAASTKSSIAPGAVPNAPVGGEDLRMIAGSATPYFDRSGQTWGPDRFFSGGSVFVWSSERIRRTLDPDIYRHVRQGDFSPWPITGA